MNEIFYDERFTIGSKINTQKVLIKAKIF